MRIRSSLTFAIPVSIVISTSLLAITACTYNEAARQDDAMVAADDSRLIMPPPAESDALELVVPAMPMAPVPAGAVSAMPSVDMASSRLAYGYLDHRALRSGGAENTENYLPIESNGITQVAEHPVSTFSVDVDTGSYANVRRFLTSGHLPPGDAVRVEEMINYFNYDYDTTAKADQPFSLSWEVARTPWNEKTVLLKLGLKGYVLPETETRPAANIVFLLDVSGSMASADKLPLMVSSMKMLAGQLNAEDRVSIVVYAGASGVVLDSAAGDSTGEIKAALSQLQAGGSTAGAEGIELAYALAAKNYVEGGLNRVFLATDGDFNVGITNIETLKDVIARKRADGISLTTLGFGRGNLNDALMEQLADTGDGNYAYIDTLKEARKVLVEELSGTLMTIAKDVKVQIEFNPAIVAEYRLIGYENRLLNREDFRNDKVDAGEIGSGHTVTALYEIALVGSGGERVAPLRYGDAAVAPKEASVDEFAYLKLRYKQPDGDRSKLITVPLTTEALRNIPAEGSRDMRFASAVAAFGQWLRDGSYTDDFGPDGIVRLAESATKGSGDPYKSEFVELVRLAREMESIR